MTVTLKNYNVTQEEHLFRVDMEVAASSNDVRVYSYYMANQPSDDDINNKFAQIKADIQHEQEVAQNPLNQDVSSLLVSTFQDTLLDVVQYVRNNPEITENDFLSWYNTEHPINVLGGDRLLNYAKLMLGMPSFDDLKNFIINQKFVGLDL